LGQPRDGKGFLDNFEPAGGVPSPDDRHAGRVQLLLLPDRATDHLHAHARGEFASALAVVIKQLAAAIDERFLRVIRQTDCGLPFRG
jgi:hypothetical protein